MNIFLARQAIYDKDSKSIAYELLYRNSNNNEFDFNIDEDEATRKLISNSITIGLKELTQEKIAFINFTKRLLLDEVPSIFDKQKIVIEILESVQPTKEVMMALHKLKRKGYKLALDDVNYSSSYWSFGDLIDIYKIDFISTTKEEREELVESIRILNPGARLLAEKVETQEEYEEAQKAGYTYYQGFLFSKPLMMIGKDIPIRNFVCFKLLSELLDNDFEVNEVEKLIKSDVGISYKLIKMLNSASYNFIQKISSIKQAIMLIGREELRKWLTIIAMSEMQSSNEEEITKSIIVRARFCELIAEETFPEKKATCFLAGLFSNLDTYMQKSMYEIVDELPVEEDLKRALLGEGNDINKVIRLVESYEKIDKNEIEKLSKELQIKPEKLINLYIESVNWQNNLDKSFK